MNSQLFFLVNFLIGGLFLIWFLSARKGGGKGPTQLRLKSKDSTGSAKPVPGAFRPPPPSKAEVEESPPPGEDSPRTEKALNILFIYNGHDWDAYAVLGLPAGASLPTVTARYQELIQSADQGQREFYEAAYKAILKKT